MTRSVALLRGINVGGRAKVPMADLRRFFVELGHRNVVTYINSGNVVFSPGGGEKADELERPIERRIADELGLTVTVMVRPGDAFTAVYEGNPFVAQGVDAASLYVAFLATEPTPEQVGRLVIPEGERVDFQHAGRELYLCYPDGYATTKVSNTYLEKRLGIAATTRNWRTVTKLHELATVG